MNLDVALFALGLACFVIAAFLGGMYILGALKRPAGLQMQEDDPGDCHG